MSGVGSRLDGRALTTRSFESRHRRSGGVRGKQRSHGRRASRRGTARRATRRSPPHQRTIRGWPRPGRIGADDQERPHRQRRRRAGARHGDAHDRPWRTHRRSRSVRRARALHASRRQPWLRGAPHRTRVLDRGAAGGDREARGVCSTRRLHHLHWRLEPHTTRRESTADEGGTGRGGAEARRLHLGHWWRHRRDHEQRRPRRSSPREA